MNKVLEYANVLYETGKYEDSKTILADLFRMSMDNKKNLSKVILALWKLYAMNILSGNWNETLNTFDQIKNVISTLRNSLEDEFKKSNNDSVN